jgi:hypothetical protein
MKKYLIIGLTFLTTLVNAQHIGFSFHINPLPPPPPVVVYTVPQPVVYSTVPVYVAPTVPTVVYTPPPPTPVVIYNQPQCYVYRSTPMISFGFNHYHRPRHYHNHR